jgi:hypothetical protein
MADARVCRATRPTVVQTPLKLAPWAGSRTSPVIFGQAGRALAGRAALPRRDVPSGVAA